MEALKLGLKAPGPLSRAPTWSECVLWNIDAWCKMNHSHQDIYKYRFTRIDGNARLYLGAKPRYVGGQVKSLHFEQKFCLEPCVWANIDMAGLKEN